MAREIQLTRGQVAVVDDEDYEYLMQWKWQALGAKGTQSYYATRSQWVERKKRIHVTIHGVLLPVPEGFIVDHIDGDTLNDRRSNLRIATKSQNGANSKKKAHNTSGFKGVHKATDANRWVARIGVGYTRHYLGCFKTPELAHEAYKAAAIKYFGEFANAGQCYPICTNKGYRCLKPITTRLIRSQRHGYANSLKRGISQMEM